MYTNEDQSTAGTVTFTAFGQHSHFCFSDCLYSEHCRTTSLKVFFISILLCRSVCICVLYNYVSSDFKLSLAFTLLLMKNAYIVCCMYAQNVGDCVPYCIFKV